jgi:hypothetical protein
MTLYAYKVTMETVGSFPWGLRARTGRGESVFAVDMGGTFTTIAENIAQVAACWPCAKEIKCCGLAYQTVPSK